jgi:cytidylate kinase
MAVITISRQYGSGGDEIAARVCDMLGYRYFDRRIMANMASEFGLSADSIVDFSEDMYEVRSFLDRLRGPRVVAQTRAWREEPGGRRVPEVQDLDEDLVIRLVQGTIQAVYEDDNIVILGRGGQAILKDMPGVLHVRIEAPPDDRAQRIQDQEEASPQVAQRTIAERDRAATAYLKRFYDIDWSDPVYYHMVINTGKLDIEAVAHLIVNALSYLPAVESPDEEEERAGDE